MADGTVEVGVEIGSPDQEVKKLVDQLSSAFSATKKLADGFQASISKVSDLRKQIDNLNQSLEQSSGKTKKAFERQIAALSKEIRAVNKTLAGVAEENKTISTVRTSVRNTISSTPGFQDASIKEALLRGQIGIINTTTAQVQARLAEAATKASKRLIQTVAASLEAQLNQARLGEEIRQITYNSAAMRQALFNRAGITNERVMRTYGDVSSLDQLEKQKAFAVAQYQAALAFDKQRDDSRKRAVVAEHQAAAAFDKEREDRQKRFVIAEHQAAAAFDKEREDRQKRFVIAEHQAATAFDKQREDGRKRVVIAQHQAATAEDKEREDRQKRFVIAQHQAAAAFDKSLQRHGTLIEKAGRSDAEFENRLRDRDVSILARASRADAEFENRQRDRAQRAASVVGGRVVLSPEEKAQQGALSASRHRSAMMDLDGGRDFLGFQARLLANYAMIGGAIATITGTAGAIGEFDDVLKRFQAITQTSNSEIGKFREGLLALGQTSRFSINELAQVAITIGQTGASAAEVEKTLKPVVSLALASGSSLQEAVEVVTSALGAYNMEAGRAAEVANILTAALNQTKLTMSQLQLGIQYSANVARDAGISFSELVASIGGIAQAGVKSGSTIGTGVRMLITDLQNPSEKLKGVLQGLGLSLIDIDTKVHGLTGVLENLRAKGFGTAQALQGLELRGAAAFAALAGQADRIKRLQESILLTDAANSGAEKAQESLIASLGRLRNSAFAVADTAFRPFVEVLKVATDWMARLTQMGSGATTMLQVFGTTLAGVAVALAAIKFSNLIGLTAALAGVTAGATAANGALGLLARHPLVATVVAVTFGVGIIYGLMSIQNEAEKAAEKLDKLRGVGNQLSSRELQLETALTDIGRQIETLALRRERLNSDPIGLRTAIIEAQKAYGDLGLSIKSTATSADELIAAYQRLRDELRKDLSSNLTAQLANIRAEIEALTEKARRGAPATIDALARSRGYGMFVRSSAEDYLRNQPGMGPFQRAIDIVSNPIGALPRNDARNTALEARRPILAEIEKAERQILQELNTTADPKIANSAVAKEESLKFLREKVEWLKKFDAAVDDAAKTVEGLRANDIKLDQLKIDEEMRRLQGNPEFKGLEGRAFSLTARLSEQARAIAGSTTLGPDERYNRLRELMQKAAPEATELVKDLQAFAQALIESGASSEAIKQATQKLRETLAALAGAQPNQEMLGLLDQTKDARGLKLGADRQLSEAELQRQMKRLSLSKSVEEQDLIKQQVMGILDRQFEIEKQIILNKDANPDKPSEATRYALEEAQRRGTEVRQRYLDQLTAERKRLDERIFEFQDRGLDNQKKDVDARIADIKKKLADPRTLTSQLDGLLTELNKLLETAKDIVKRQNDIAAQRERASINTPDAVLPSLAAPSGSVQAQIVEGTRQLGQKMVDYFLAAANFESSFDPKNYPGKRQGLAFGEGASKAAGLFQFMPGTWEQYGSGDIWEIANQINAMIKFTQQNVAAFQKKYGRDPTQGEIFLMHNQGAGGAFRLLDNPFESAVDMVGRKAVVNNGGGVNMTSAEFADTLMRRFVEAASKLANRYTTTPAAVIASSRDAKNRAADTEAETQRREAEKTVEDRRRRLEDLKLANDEATIKRRLELDRGVLRSSEDVGETRRAAEGTITALRLLMEKDLDRLRNKRPDLTAEERGVEEGKIRGEFSDQIAKQAIANAEALEAVTKRQYDVEVKRLEAREQLISKAVADGKASERQLDTAHQLTEEAKKRRDTEGELGARRAVLVELERQLVELTKEGLLTEEGKRALNDRILSQKRQIAELEKTEGVRKRLDANNPNDFGRATENAVRSFEKSRGIWNTSANRYATEAEQFGKMLESALGSIASNMDTLWEKLASGSMKAKDAVKEFARSVLTDLLKLASRSLTNSILQSIFGAFSGGGGGGGGFLASIFGGGGGGVEVVGSIGSAAFGGGGFVRAAQGLYVPTRDSVPAMLQPGEYVVRASAVDAIGRETLDSINQMGPARRAEAMTAPKGEDAGTPSLVNIWVVSPDQRPGIGPNDIVVTIADNIQRGGSIKQLIKQVAVGG